MKRSLLGPSSVGPDRLARSARQAIFLPLLLLGRCVAVRVCAKLARATQAICVKVCLGSPHFAKNRTGMASQRTG